MYKRRAQMTAYLGHVWPGFLREEDGRLDIDIQDLLYGAVWHVQNEACCRVDGCIGHQHIHRPIRVHGKLHQPLQVLLLANVRSTSHDLNAPVLQQSDGFIHIALGQAYRSFVGWVDLVLSISCRAVTRYLRRS